MPDTAALITALIIDRPLCVPCLGAKAHGLTEEALETYLTVIARVLRLQRATDRCRACGDHTITVSLQRPSPGEPY